MSATREGGMPYFPMFVDLSGVRAVVIGGGRVAARRAGTLASFCREVVIIAPQTCTELEALGLPIQYRAYTPGDCVGFELVLAATDSREVNHAVFLEARAAGITVNVSDAPEECDFFFPAVVRQDPVVIGVTAGGRDHRLVKETARRLRDSLNELIPPKEEANAKT